MRIVSAYLTAAAVLLSGCVGGDLIAVKDQEIGELRARSEAVSAQLERVEERLVQTQQKIHERQTELDRARSENGRLSGELREVREAEADRSKTQVQMSSRLFETERAYETLKKTLKSVQDEAATLAEQVSESSVNSAETATRLSTAESSVKQLEQERGALEKELEKAKEDLRRKDVAMNAIRSASSAPDEQLVGYQAEIDQLKEKARSDLAVRKNLMAQVEELKQLVPEGTDTNVAGTISSNELYRQDPDGLWAEVSGFLGSRFGAMTSGEAKWDSVDAGLAVFGLIVGFIGLWALWTPMRWRGRRRTRDELQQLRDQLDGVAESASSSEDDAGERPTRSRTGSVAVRRSGQFSPILVSEQPDPVEAPVMQAQTEEQDGARPRQVIGAHQWTDDSEEEEFGHTQIIPGVSEMQLGTPSIPSLSPGALSADAPSSRDPLATPAASEQVEEEEFGHTQIIPSVGDLGIGGGIQSVGEIGRPEPADEASSQDLMDELESLIGKKVDEMIQ